MEQPTQGSRKRKQKEKEISSQTDSSSEEEGSTDSEQDIEELTSCEKDLASPFNKQNIALVFGQSKLHVQKKHLITVSPVFKAMFSSNFLEGSLSEIPLPNKKLSHFVYFLRYLFPGFDDKITGHTVHDILPLADEYQTEDLKKKIEKFLIEEVSSKSYSSFSSVRIIDKIHEAERYKLDGYLKACVEVASRKRIKSLRKIPKFEEISKNTQLQIFSKRCEDIDDMFTTVVEVVPANTSYARRNQQNRVAPLKYVGLEYVGEYLRQYMKE